MNAVVGALMLAAMTPATDPSAVERHIRHERARSNAAIARHDVAGMRAVLAQEYTVLPGSTGLPSRLDTFDARMRSTFADPTFVTYVRTPERVTVAGSGERAAETGTWTGVWNKPAGAMRLAGIYQATWIPTAAGWRLLNESFVTLGCTGAGCGQPD